MPDPIDFLPLAAALGIPLRPEWHDSIRANLEMSLRMAAEVAAFPLDDDLDLAPIFIA